MLWLNGTEASSTLVPTGNSNLCDKTESNKNETHTFISPDVQLFKEEYPVHSSQMNAIDFVGLPQINGAQASQHAQGL